MKGVIHTYGHDHSYLEPQSRHELCVPWVARPEYMIFARFCMEFQHFPDTEGTVDSGTLKVDAKLGSCGISISRKWIPFGVIVRQVKYKVS